MIERDLLHDIAQVRQPIRVIQGGGDPIVEAPQHLAWPPNAELIVTAADDGHDTLLLERPAEAAGFIRSFEASARARQEMP